MYTIKCDGFPLLDVRDEELILVKPQLKLETNKVGECSFKIYKNHPYYNKLKKLKSLFEIADKYGVLFRGRMTDSTRDFEDGMAVDLEGSMAFFNDSMVRPFSFPGDFLENAEYNASKNKVEFFLKWLVDNHNSQVQDFQKFKLGTVTVSDPNNYINRSTSTYVSTWEALKQKLFDSSLGGYLCIRYEEDGNYIDYLSDFTETNAQGVEFGENLLGLVRETDATSTYSAIIPIGATLEGEPDKDGNVSTTLVTIEGLADSNTTDDIVKKGDTLYSKSAVAAYGWIYAPVEDTTWEDVTEPSNLLKKGKEWLSGQGIMLSETVEVKAADMHFTNEEISSFRLYKKINVRSKPHGIEMSYILTKLDIDILNPQNTKITVGETKLTLTEMSTSKSDANKFSGDIATTKQEVSTLKAQTSILQKQANDLQSEFTVIQKTAGQVSVKVGDEEGTLETNINPTTWEAKYTDADGNEVSGLRFDFINKRFVLNATGQFGGVNSGDAYIQISGSDLILYDEAGEESVVVGYEDLSDSKWSEVIAGTMQLGYIKFVTNILSGKFISLIKRFYDGLWIGNHHVTYDQNGWFVPEHGAAGIFFSASSGGKVTVYNGTTGQDVYTGEAIAKFG